MLSFDQIMSGYEAYIRTREVKDDVEWTERKETDSDDRGSETEAE